MTQAKKKLRKGGRKAARPDHSGYSGDPLADIVPKAGLASRQKLLLIADAFLCVLAFLPWVRFGAYSYSYDFSVPEFAGSVFDLTGILDRMTPLFSGSSAEAYASTSQAFQVLAFIVVAIWLIGLAGIAVDVAGRLKNGRGKARGPFCTGVSGTILILLFLLGNTTISSQLFSDTFSLNIFSATPAMWVFTVDSFALWAIQDSFEKKRGA